MNYGTNQFRNAGDAPSIPSLSLSSTSTSTSTATGGNVSIDMSKKMDENKSNTIIVIGAMVAVVGIMGFVFYKMTKN
jgi:hypothetical protein